MPSVSEAMFQALSETPEVQAIVGDRIHPDQVGIDDEMPYLCFQTSGKHTPKTLRGKVDISRCEVELVGYAAERQDVTKLRDALEDLLDGKVNILLGGLPVKSCRVLEPGFADEDEPADDSENSGKRVLRGTVGVWF